MVAMTSRKRDTPVVRMNVWSENVLGENAGSRSSFASLERNRLSRQNMTRPMVPAIVSVCACCAGSACQPPYNIAGGQLLSRNLRLLTAALHPGCDYHHVLERGRGGLGLALL